MNINQRNLKTAMATNCLSIRELQTLGEVSRMTIVKALNDPTYEPIPKTIGKLANALGVSVQHLTAPTEVAYD